jgi:hypothetical protein
MGRMKRNSRLFRAAKHFGRSLQSARHGYKLEARVVDGIEVQVKVYPRADARPRGFDFS